MWVYLTGFGIIVACVENSTCSLGWNLLKFSMDSYKHCYSSEDPRQHSQPLCLYTFSIHLIVKP